eukprot:254523_1
MSLQVISMLWVSCFALICHAFPSNLFSESDLELFRPMQNKKDEFMVRWNDKHRLIWIETHNKEQYIFCMRNSTITSSIRSTSNKPIHRDPRSKFNQKTCLFDGLCNVDTPEFELIHFYKHRKRIGDSTLYRFQSNYNYYLDLETTDPLYQMDQRITNKQVRLCRQDNSKEQLFQSIHDIPKQTTPQPLTQRMVKQKPDL